MQFDILSVIYPDSVLDEGGEDVRGQINIFGIGRDVNTNATSMVECRVGNDVPIALSSVLIVILSFIKLDSRSPCLRL